MKVFVIIVTYNGSKWIKKCLNSLYSGTFSISIKIIDNASSDDTVSIIKEYFPKADLIQSEKNLGFGKANNMGIKKAIEEGADYFFLLNQDAWIEENTIERLIEISKKNPNYGILSPMHLNADYSSLDFNFSRYIIPDHCPGLYADIYLNKTKNVYPVDFVNAAAWMISRACVETVGLFDPLFFHYGEDRNYCQRVLYHGLKIGICPDLRIVHDRGDRKGVIKKYSGKEELRRFQLIKFCDIGLNNFRIQYLKYLACNIFKGCAYGIIFHFKRAQYNFSEVIYFFKKRRAILESRIRNYNMKNTDPKYFDINGNP